MAIHEVNSENYEALILSNTRTVLADFWAQWCGPCKMLAPVLEAFAAKHPEMDIVRVNVDDNYPLAAQYRISAIPALLLFKDGKEVTRFVGYMTLEALEAKISQI